MISFPSKCLILLMFAGSQSGGAICGCVLESSTQCCPLPAPGRTKAGHDVTGHMIKQTSQDGDVPLSSAEKNLGSGLYQTPENFYCQHL